MPDTSASLFPEPLPIAKAPASAQAAARKPDLKKIEPEARLPMPESASASSSEADGGRRSTAQQMATRQREISVSEFFTKNRHLLGFDSPLKALLTAVKEAVDNSLDACEEAGILPEIWVELKPTTAEHFRMVVEDNGPGIVSEQIGKVFGKLLYGSKFHKLAQSRGQQGIGISAAGMYGQLTTGKPVRILSRTGKKADAHEFVMSIDTARNKPDIHESKVVAWEREGAPKAHGTRVEIEMEAKYQKGLRSVDMFLKQTAIANPHLTLHYDD
ncbi:MAG: DNA topoisomerase VI subunit B, partial [Planctomycetota bacterium]